MQQENDSVDGRFGRRVIRELADESLTKHGIPEIGVRSQVEPEQMRWFASETLFS